MADLRRISSAARTVKEVIGKLNEWCDRLNGLNAGYDCWDDLRTPATVIPLAGFVNDPDYDDTYGGILFDPDVIEAVFIQVQMPHAWKEGSNIIPHVHWMKSTSAAGDVLWQLNYRWAPIGEVMDSEATVLTVSSPVGGTPDADTANQHLISSFGEVDTTGKSISDMLLMVFGRIGTSEDDTYDADARLIEFDIHYQIDAFGSAGQFTK